MTRYEYEHEFFPGGRGYTRLYLVRGGRVEKFIGGNVPGFAVVAAKYYYDWGEKYILLLAPGTVPFRIVPPEKGEWGDWWEDWGDLAAHLGVSVDEAKSFVALEYPSLAERLDAVEQFKREYGE